MTPAIGKMNAAEAAILQLALARLSVDVLSARIRDSLKACDDRQRAKNPGKPTANHLEAAYAMHRDESAEEYDRELVYTNHEYDDPGMYLAEVCSHCFNAHEAIQERKLARKRHGIAKSRVSRLGSMLLKAANKAEGGAA